MRLAVHPSLSRAQEITKLFDQYEAKYRREPVGVGQADIPELVDFCEHTRFRQQFIEACGANGVPAQALRDDGWWHSFLVQFSEVVRDCPIEAKADGTMYVTHVTASAISPRDIGITNRQFAICWTWHRKDSDQPGIVVSLF